MIKTQKCVACGEVKAISEFEKQKDRPNPRKVCKVCRYRQRDHEKEKARHREYMKERRAKNPDAVRINWERSTYGVAKEDIGVYECMICGSDARVCIDHCHDTGVVRGILCTKCNLGLGSFDDSIDKLKAAISYLKDSPHIQIEGAQ